ncbi:MAG: ABC transporter permease [Anaerolineaceae bacterium]|nr:MAG: ABC transporter permease [Anaerolineaceae bacterium]
MTLNMVVEHLLVVCVAVILTVLLGLPLGILAYIHKKAGKVILWIVDILQTIPALAMLGVIMIVFGAGKTTVIIGLVLYSLLPIVHNTHLGLTEVGPAIKDAAIGMGMSKLQRLIMVELPLAFPVIFTGIRIATVTSIGVAVFGSFVGGGGLGSILYRGIHIQNMRLILSGTLALMTMAIIFDFGMSWIEKRMKAGMGYKN